MSISCDGKILLSFVPCDGVFPFRLLPFITILWALHFFFFFVNGFLAHGYSIIIITLFQEDNIFASLTYGPQLQR